MALRVSTREKRLLVIAAVVALLAGYGVVRYGKPARQARQAEQTKLSDLEETVGALTPPTPPSPGVKTLEAEAQGVRASIAEHERHLAEQTRGFAMVEDNASLNRHRSMIAQHAERSGLTIIGSRPVALDARAPGVHGRPSLVQALADATGSPRVLEKWTTRGRFSELTDFVEALDELDQHVSVILMTVRVVDSGEGGHAGPPVLEAVLTLMM